MVPEERQVSQRRCCCVQEPPPSPIPCQPCPTVPESVYPSWSVYVEATGIIGDKAGAGSYATGPFYAYDCEKGPCGRVMHSRKAVGWPDPAQLPDCEEADVCEALVETDGLISAGSAELTWKGPLGGGTNQNQNCCGTFVPDGIPSSCIIANTYDQWVQIEWVQSCMKWNGCNFPQWEAAPVGHPDVRTLIKVNYYYEDSFQYPVFLADPGCPRTTATWTVRYYWSCVYARRPRPNQRFAEGAYALVYCNHYSVGARTYGPSPTLNAIRCPELNDTHCSADGLTPINASSTWKPPTYITLMRLS